MIDEPAQHCSLACDSDEVFGFFKVARTEVIESLMDKTVAGALKLASTRGYFRFLDFVQAIRKNRHAEPQRLFPVTSGTQRFACGRHIVAGTPHRARNFRFGHFILCAGYLHLCFG
jgi:hypothetical protein